jgi:hypothetical protein
MEVRPSGAAPSTRGPVAVCGRSAPQPQPLGAGLAQLGRDLDADPAGGERVGPLGEQRRHLAGGEFEPDGWVSERLRSMGANRRAALASPRTRADSGSSTWRPASSSPAVPSLPHPGGHDPGCGVPSTAAGRSAARSASRWSSGRGRSLEPDREAHDRLPVPAEQRRCPVLHLGRDVLRRDPQVGDQSGRCRPGRRRTSPATGGGGHGDGGRARAGGPRGRTRPRWRRGTPRAAPGPARAPPTAAGPRARRRASPPRAAPSGGRRGRPPARTRAPPRGCRMAGRRGADAPRPPAPDPAWPPRSRPGRRARAATTPASPNRAASPRAPGRPGGWAAAGRAGPGRSRPPRRPRATRSCPVRPPADRAPRWPAAGAGRRAR